MISSVLMSDMGFFIEYIHILTEKFNIWCSVKQKPLVVHGLLAIVVKILCLLAKE